MKTLPSLHLVLHLNKHIFKIQYENYSGPKLFLSQYKHTFQFNQMAQFQYENTKVKLKANTLI